MNILTPEQQQARDDLLNWLDNGAPETPCVAYSEPIVSFCMATFDTTTPGCGTQCCMGGFIMRNTSRVYGEPLTVTAARLLGLNLSARQCDALFIPSAARHEEPQPIQTRDTAWAARTMRYLFATGKVDWEKTR
jgi:hypothetical protein